MFYIVYRIYRFVVWFIYTITLNKLPFIVGVILIIKDKEGRLLVQKRADGYGYGLIGGLTKVGVSLEENLKREVLEETGLNISNFKFLFNYTSEKKDSYIVSVVYETIIEHLQPKGSWEGEALWKSYHEIKDNMALDFGEVLERYYREYSNK